MGWANGAHAPPVKDRAAAARLASSGSGRLRDMPRRTQGECGSWSRRHGLRFSRDEDAGSRTRQWPIPGLWEWRRARSASTNRRRCENEADLIGERRTATGAIGGKLRLILRPPQTGGLFSREIDEYPAA